MADHVGKARARRAPGLRLPKSVEGLIEAMRAMAAGDSRPLEAWDRKRCPILRDALEAWTGDLLLAEHLAAIVVRQAWRTAEARREIRSEIPWMEGIARRGRARILRDEHPIGEQLPPDCEAPAADPLETLICQEDREHVRRLIAGLPGKYQLALTLRYIHGLSEAEVASLFERSFGVGFDGTRWTLKEGRKMVKTALAGGDPRRASPRRYGPPGGNPKNPAGVLPPRPPSRNY